MIWERNDPWQLGVRIEEPRRPCAEPLQESSVRRPSHVAGPHDGRRIEIGAIINPLFVWIVMIAVSYDHEVAVPIILEIPLDVSPMDAPGGHLGKC